MEALNQLRITKEYVRLNNLINYLGKVQGNTIDKKVMLPPKMLDNNTPDNSLNFFLQNETTCSKNVKSIQVGVPLGDPMGATTPQQRPPNSSN